MPDLCIYRIHVVVVPWISRVYRIACNFRGVKISLFSWVADLDEIFTPRKSTVTHPMQCSSEANEILPHEKLHVREKRNFYPTKITRYTVLDLYYQGQLYVFPRAQPEGNTYSCTRLYKQYTRRCPRYSLYYEHLLLWSHLTNHNDNPLPIRSGSFS